MKISSLPANFDCAFSDLIYTITEAEPQQLLEVSIIGESIADVLGVKHYRGQAEYSVNISGYMRRKMNVLPYYRNSSAYYLPAGRTAVGRISVGNTVTERRVFGAGAKTKRAGVLLSDAPLNQTITKEDIDELSFFGEYTEIIGIYCFLSRGSDVHELAMSKLARGDDQMISFVLNMNDFVNWASRSGKLGGIDEYDYLEVNVEVGSRLVPVKRYELRPVNDRNVRICWVNAYGAIDYYTFLMEDAERIVTNQSKIYDTGGYKTYDAATQRLRSLRSEYVNAETISWLADIMASPRVWITPVRNEFCLVDVVGGDVVAAEGSPSYFRLTLREKTKLQYQNF